MCRGPSPGLTSGLWMDPGAFLWVSGFSPPMWVRDCLLHRIARRLENNVHAGDSGAWSLIMANETCRTRRLPQPRVVRAWRAQVLRTPVGSLSRISGVLWWCLSTAAGDDVVGFGA